MLLHLTDQGWRWIMTFFYNGIELSAADFPRTIQGWVAFSIAMAAATQCRDKAAALAMLEHEAEKVIRCARTGKIPGGGS